MKKFLMGCITGSIIAISLNVFASSNSISVTTQLVNFLINGQNAVTDAIEYQGHLYVPIRFVGENLGSKVDWNDATSTVSITPESIGEMQKAHESSAPNITTLKMPTGEKNQVSVVVKSIATNEGNVVVQLKITNMSAVPIKVSDISDSSGKLSNVHISLENSSDLVSPDLTKVILPGLSVNGIITLPTLNEGSDSSSIKLELKITHIAGINPVDSFDLDLPVG